VSYFCHPRSSPGYGDGEMVGMQQKVGPMKTVFMPHLRLNGNGHRESCHYGTFRVPIFIFLHNSTFSF